MEQQRKCPGCDGTLIDGDFIIEYDVKREKNAGEIQVICHKIYFLYSSSEFNVVQAELVF